MSLLFRDSTKSLPKASDATQFQAQLEKLREHVAQLPDVARKRAESFLSQPHFLALLEAVFGNSPYLSRLILQFLPFFLDVYEHGSEAGESAIRALLEGLNLAEITQAELMHTLRRMKSKTALLCAVADITQHWEVMQVTNHLSIFAQEAIDVTTRFLLIRAHQQGELALANPTAPLEGSGLVILGMGKLGANELNYSSDIDLIVFFEREWVPYTGNKNVQHWCNRFAQDLQAILQDLTEDGYVFRTDLRLRPDPSSTPLAVSVAAALTYYETVGQNWERAAMIKARPMSGDPKACDALMRDIRPFIWRKYLDFASIADIHSIKRQMNVKVGGELQAGGHNVKLGVGGIREIEFFVQTQQLVWGGRMPQLRTRPTLETMDLLVEAGHVSAENATFLKHAYQYLRRVEHHIQMVDDQQSHTLPATDAGVAHIATFLGYDTPDDFRKELVNILTQVHRIYTESMEGSETLASEGNLVFTGVDPDPNTMKTLESMGYTSARTICEIVANWHRGSRRATRSKRARQLLTELVPAILAALSKTANPDSAFFRFDDFLSRLPVGVQLFSMFSARPELIDLLATILGSAPALAETLSKHPALFDTVLHGDFYKPLPSYLRLAAMLRSRIEQSTEHEDQLDILRVFKAERGFQAGVHMLTGMVSAEAVGEFLSNLADVLLAQVSDLTQREFQNTYGSIAGSQFAIVSLGKLGAREMTFESDLDLIFVYQTLSPDDVSDGEKSYDARIYYNRLCQRIVGALTAMSREGKLYEVDTRLRPSGGDSPLALSYDTLVKYYGEAAWTFEFMALTKARVVLASGDHFRTSLEQMIWEYLSMPRDAGKIANEIFDLREKVQKELGHRDMWRLKHVRGGLLDQDFIAQYLILIHAHKHPELVTGSTSEAFARAAQANLCFEDDAQTIIRARRLMADLQSFLRLCKETSTDEEHLPTGLQNLIVERLHMKDFDHLKAALQQSQANVLRVFDNVLVPTKFAGGI